MSASYKKQHYVPQTYLDAWKDNHNKVYVYNKVDGELHKYCKTERVLYENDIYTKTANDNVTLTEKEICEIFKVLDEYKIKYVDENYEKDLTTHDEYSTYYYDFEKWVIRREDGSIVSKKGIKDSIDKTRITTLEEQWKCIENNWSSLRENIEYCINNEIELTDKVLDDLIEFLVAQKYRTPKSLKASQNLIGDILQPMKSYMGNWYQKEIDYLGQEYFKNQILKYQNEDSRGIICKEIETLKTFHLVLFKALDRMFITSDSPVFNIHDNDFYKGKYNAIYLPISPYLMLGIFKGSSTRYSVDELPSNVVRRFNKKIKENSFRYYVTNYKYS